MGIRSKFILIMVALSLISSVVVGFVNYRITRQTALDEAKDKGLLLFNYIQASKKFFKKHQRPLIGELLVDKERFYPEIMSGFVVQRMEYEIFKRRNQGFEFKQATLDPLWPDNKANDDEIKLIRYFEQNPDIGTREGTITRNGIEYFYIAEPVSIDKKFCLKCHSDPAKAPEDQREIYGTEHGYNWKLGDTVGVSIVYISIDKAMAKLKKNTILFLVIGSSFLFLTVCCIWFFLDRKIVAPLLKLSAIAEDISVGKNLGQHITITTKDEVGGLAKSISRLQNSVRMLLKRTRLK